MKPRIAYAAIGLALALVGCNKMTPATDQIPDVAGIYTGKYYVTSGSDEGIDFSTSIPVRVEVTQDGANVQVRFTHIAGEPVGGEGEIYRDHRQGWQPQRRRMGRATWYRRGQARSPSIPR